MGGICVIPHADLLALLKNILVDLVSQLEALNPTANPSSNCEGEWDLCLSSTQFFRSSPFFQSIRVAMGDSNKAMAENAFDIHDRATTASRVGRVRQSITRDQLVSEVDLEVGLLPGLPFRAKGTVVTTASLQVVSPETWETRIESTSVKGSNVPLFNQMLEDLNFDFPVNNVYSTLLGEVPVVELKTFYVDEGIRITRDVDDNFYVFSRS
jgi:hypothetical protein